MAEILTRREFLRLLDHCRRNGGATLDRDGAPVTFPDGYQVSRKDCYTLDPEHVNTALQAVRAVLAELQPGDFCGLWINAAGRLCVDVSIRIPDLETALQRGREWGQIAIYSWATGEDILC